MRRLLTAGCPNECRYCYAQSYPHHPGWGKVAFYANALERLRAEFHLLRPKPFLVYFSTAGEPFLPIEPILDHLFGVMEFLLGEGVRVFISTKCWIPERFVDLFRAHPGLVFVQVGVTTLDDGARQVLEPNAATVAQRLDNLTRLLENGVASEARMDPLVPGLTDDELSLDALLYELSRRGVRQAAASYLFLRWGIRWPSGLAWSAWSFQTMRRLYTHRVDNYCGGGRIWLPSSEYRRRKYADLKTLGDAHGIQIHLCRCKNADVTEECCHPRPTLRGAWELRRAPASNDPPGQPASFL
ncbi:MAG: radical SAM protein [Candidatus Sumerlaeota bacterium]|nr:radical SAM protein [Candidatus Sumerlaeota bacterium]